MKSFLLSAAETIDFDPDSDFDGDAHQQSLRKRNAYLAMVQRIAKKVAGNGCKKGETLRIVKSVL